MSKFIWSSDFSGGDWSNQDTKKQQQIEFAAVERMDENLCKILFPLEFSRAFFELNVAAVMGNHIFLRMDDLSSFVDV